MITHFYPLLYAFEQSNEPPPQNLLERVRALPPVGVLPALWSVWLLISILVYRQRQRWARVFVRRQRPDFFPPNDYWCNADQPAEMNLPGWHLQVECGFGWGSLTNNTTQEFITFGLNRAHAEPILFLDDFPEHTRPASRWEPAGRLVELHPGNFRAEIWRAIHDLVAVHYLTGIDYDGSRYHPDVQPAGHRLNHQIAEDYTPPVLQFCERWQQAENRLWLSSLVGDWLLAYELAQDTGDAELITVTGERAAECNRLRAEMRRLATITHEWNQSHPLRRCRARQ